ncbi:hypothetical protein COCC4DRAFT_115804, partial [Bipolaris maydis ATCC 48331]
IPTLSKRAPTIDFIDMRLSKYHPAFSSQSVRYDPMSRHYVPASQVLVANMNNSLATPPASNAQPSGNGLPQRPEWTDTSAMKFWNEVFPDAMIKLKSMKEPKGRPETLYHIRDKPNWDAIYHTLESARAEYQKSGNPVSWMRNMRRKAADNITPGVEVTKIASKSVPQDPIATPVIGAVGVVLDAFQTAANVRNQVLAGFDGVIPIFSDVEVFLSTFQGDVNIRNASIDLIAATLEAVERAIGFFISNEFFRGGKALLSGEKYEESLLQSLTMIQTKASDLMQQALKSHIFQFQMFSQETKRVFEQHVNQVNNLVAGNNNIEQLLRDHLQQKDLQLERVRQENVYLKVENGILRSTSPVQQITWAPPQQSALAPAPGCHMNQEMLRNIIATFDLDFDDVAFVMDKKGQLSGKDMARAEQIIHTRLFQNWIVSASSSKLLVHWDLSQSRRIAEVSPLSVFCMTLVQTLRTKDRFMSALWFCGCHVDESEPGARTGGHAMLLSLIDQLLRQFQFDTRSLYNDIDLVSLGEGGLEVPIKLLDSLVRQLPPHITLFIIIDGVVLFEREQFVDEALEVFASLIRLVVDASVMASVKVLFTSTPGTAIVRSAFEPENLILAADNLPRPAVWSEERMVRELEGELGD